MRTAGHDAHGRRLRGLIVVLWRAGLRIQEALALAEADLDHRRGALLVRCRKGGRRREVGMDAWGWDELQPWLELRVELPVGPLFRVLNGRTRGRQWSSAAARTELRRTAVAAGVRRRFAPHRLRHATPSKWPEKACRSWSSSASSDRQRRDHRHRPRRPRTDELGEHFTSALTDVVTLLVARSGSEWPVRF